jgi:hypothetical protein
MADTRTLKLSLLADVNKFTSGMKQAEMGTKTLDSKIKKYSKAMALSFAAVGTAAAGMAFKIGVDSVKAAVEDELSQKKLATALRNTVKATNAQIKSTEEYISRQQMAYGIADTQLRPALANLVRATGDLTKAQQLNNLAIDISSATGKDLETVSLALSKAYTGNLGALKKLGVPLSDSIVKSKDFTKATGVLTKLFGGSAKANTQTYAGQLAILQQRFGEIQENIGGKLIPKLKLLLEQVNLVAKGFSGEDPNGLTTRARELAGEFAPSGAYSLGRSLDNIAQSMGRLVAVFSSGDANGAVSLLGRLADAINLLAKGIDLYASAYGKLKSIGGNLLDTITMGDGKNGYASKLPAIPFGDPNRNNPAGRAAGNTTIIMNGVIDGESARRSIQKVMQDSSLRTSKVNLIGSAL